MRSNRVYGKYLAVIAILLVFIYGVAATSVANVPEDETKKHDTSVKSDNADSHPVGDLTIGNHRTKTKVHGSQVGSGHDKAEERSRKK